MIIFATKIDMKNLKISIKWNYLAIIVICVAFLYLFCDNSLLRPSPASAQAKEYGIGVLLLVVCCLNAFVFHPLFFQRNKPVAYMISTFISIIIVIVVEFSWLYSDIMDNLLITLSSKEAHSYYWNCVFFASLRDTGLFSFTFLLCELNKYRNQRKQTENLLIASENKIEVKDFDDNLILLNYMQIRFCEQDRNLTKIYGIRNKVYFRYGSLKSLQNLVGSEHLVQINRNTLVMKRQIRQYSDGQLWLFDEDTPFEVSSTFRNQKDLIPIPPKSDVSKINKRKKKKKTKVLAANNEKTKEVQQLIADNPEISAVKISEQTSISQSTVNRILAQLKKEGLIEYVGSKKTGGYKVV
jgi:ribosomal protein S25